MVEARSPFTETYDLVVLLKEAVAVEPSWKTFVRELRPLSKWGALLDPPKANARAGDVRDAIKICRRFRAAARQSLGL
jgi:hypothetical protein